MIEGRMITGASTSWCASAVGTCLLTRSAERDWGIDREPRPILRG